MARIALQLIPLRLIVRQAVDEQAPICDCSAEVAQRWLHDELLRHAIADDRKALPQHRPYSGNQARMVEDIAAAIEQADGWQGAIAWLHRVMMEKVRIHAAAGALSLASGRQRCEHTAIQSGLILARLQRVKTHVDALHGVDPATSGRA
jgi:hypothetical protein